MHHITHDVKGLSTPTITKSRRKAIDSSRASLLAASCLTVVLASGLEGCGASTAKAIVRFASSVILDELLVPGVLAQVMGFLGRASASEVPYQFVVNISAFIANRLQSAPPLAVAPIPMSYSCNSDQDQNACLEQTRHPILASFGQYKYALDSTHSMCQVAVRNDPRSADWGAMGDLKAIVQCMSTSGYAAEVNLIQSQIGYA